MPFKDKQKRREVSRNFMRKYRENNPEKARESSMKYRINNRDSINKKRKNWYHSEAGRKYLKKESQKAAERARKRRRIVIEYYGNVCACCGENTYEFLTIEHINGGGVKHRKQIGASGISGFIIRNNFPETFTVLCYNCNCAKAYNGICPHQRKN